MSRTLQLRKTGETNALITMIDQQAAKTRRNRSKTQREKTRKSWGNMKARCLSPEHQRFRRYGGRGIQVCPRWLGPTGFRNFVEDMGDRPEGHKLNRLDKSGHYCPHAPGTFDHLAPPEPGKGKGNVRWAKA